MSPSSRWQYLLMVSLSLSTILLDLQVSSQTEGDLRLAGYGASRLAGRLEIYLNGQWGTVCSPRSPLDVAKVACRQLRLGHFISHILGETTSLRYGLGSGPVWLEEISCNTSKHLHLLRCIHRKGGVNASCDHHLDFSVMCSGVLTPYEGEVRLVGGAYASEGVVEINLHHTWAQFCSARMEQGLAETICRQLGYTNVLSTEAVENVTGQFWQLPPPSLCSSSSSSSSCIKSCYTDLLSSASLSDSCDGTAWSVECGFLESEIGNVTSGSIADCTVQSPQVENYKIRLHGNNPNQGRVEIFVDDQWYSLLVPNSEGATVVCKQLGFPTYRTSDPISDLSWVNIPPFSGSQVTLICNGLETHVNSCLLHSVEEPNHDNDAYIECSPVLWPFGSLQLLGGAGPFGQLLVSPGPHFMWLCDAHFSMAEAKVACRQMGYSSAIRIVRNSLLSDFSAVSLLSYSLCCSGEEAYLMGCSRCSVTSEVCRKDLDMVSIQCGSSSSTEGWRVRLTSVANDDDNIQNGSLHGNISEGVREGSVEVLLEKGGIWGSVCAEDFSDLSAHVVCRQLGFETFATVSRIPAEDRGPILLSSVQCTGFEDLLEYCPHSLSIGNCSHIISVECSEILPYSDGLLRLVNSSSTSLTDGQLQISYHGLWMSVCGHLFTQAVADVACRQLGFQPAANFCVDACFGQATNDIHFGDYQCHGNETRLLECGINIHNSEYCSHDNDVGLSCSPLQSMSVAVASSSSLASSPSPSPALPHLTPSQVSSQPYIPPVSNSVPHDSVTPGAGENPFISDGIIYVLVVVLCLLLLALMVSVTICCVFRKKREMLVLQAQNGSYSDRNDQAITAGQTNGTAGMIHEVADEEMEEPDFDFDAVTDSVEMKACAKAAEAMCLSPDHNSLASCASVPPPPQYHELEFLSHSLPGEETKEID